jgi:hypothetical protein
MSEEEQQREDDQITHDIERRKNWEPLFQKEENPKETENIEKEKEKTRERR